MNAKQYAMKLASIQKAIEVLERKETKLNEEIRKKFAPYKPGTIIRFRCPETNRTSFWLVGGACNPILEDNKSGFKFRLRVTRCTKDGHQRGRPTVDTVSFFSHCEVVSIAQVRRP